MSVDIERALSRELREVAEGLHVPVVPRLPRRPPRPPRRRPALLVAAAVVLVTAGTAGVVAVVTDGRTPPPAQQSPAPTPTSPVPPTPDQADGAIPGDAPTLPHVLDNRLYVDGRQVPGSWWTVRPAGQAWVAWREDHSWWWGRGPRAHALPNGEDVAPQISPNGRYVAVIRAENGVGVLTVVDTRSGSSLAGTPVSLGAQRPDFPAHVVAVLDDGRVVARRGERDLLWVPGSGGSTVELSRTAPGQVVEAATAAGLVVTDGNEGRPYLADLSSAGELSRTAGLPEHDDLVVSPDGEWLAWTPAGSTGGDVTTLPSLEVRPSAGGEPATVTAPDGWEFKVRTYVWEDDAHLLSAVTSAGHPGERMARCSPTQGRCVLTKTG